MLFQCPKHLIVFRRNGRGAVGEHALSVRRNKVPRFPLPKDRKRPLRNPTLRGHHVPSFDAPTPSSWRSSVRSRRTVRSGGEDHSWFGPPQALRKGTVRQRFPKDPCCSLRTPVKLFVLWVLHSLSPPSMWSNSPSRHELPLLHAFGRSEGLFGSPPRCRYY